MVMDEDGNMHAFFEEYNGMPYAHCIYDGFPSDDTLISEEYYEDDIKKYTVQHTIGIKASITLEGKSEEEVREQYKHLTLDDLIKSDDLTYTKSVIKVIQMK